jgi:hypothetical protein
VLKIYSEQVITIEHLKEFYESNYTAQTAEELLNHRISGHWFSWVKAFIELLVQVVLLWLIFITSFSFFSIKISGYNLFKALLITINLVTIRKILKILIFDFKDTFTFNDFKGTNPFSVSYFFKNTGVSPEIMFTLDIFHIFQAAFVFVLWYILIKTQKSVNKIQLFVIISLTYFIILTILSLTGAFLIILKT